MQEVNNGYYNIVYLYRSQSRGRSQLPSFSLPSHATNAYYDDCADDGTVPSTPTLYIAKRTDGFAEAVR